MCLGVRPLGLWRVSGGFRILSLEPGEALEGNCLWRNVGEKGGPFRSSFERFLQFGILIASVELRGAILVLGGG